MKTDFRAFAGLAMVHLGWTPETFWAATPADLFMAVNAKAGMRPQPAPMDGTELEMLRRRFPDKV